MLRWLIIPTALTAALLAGCAEDTLTCADEIVATVYVSETTGNILVDPAAPDANAVFKMDALIQVDCKDLVDHLIIVSSSLVDPDTGVNLAALNINFPGGSATTPTCDGIGTTDSIDLIDNGTPNSALSSLCGRKVDLTTVIGRVGCDVTQTSRMSKDITQVYCPTP